jgi:hypothetical protein
MGIRKGNQPFKENTMENNAFLETKKKTLGYLTGLSLILLAVTAILNFGMIRGENLAFLSQGSAQEPIGLNFGLRLEAFIWMLVVLLDLVISLTLYSYFKKEKPLMSPGFFVLPLPLYRYAGGRGAQPGSSRQHR